MNTKICKTCGRELPLDEFRKDAHGSLGRKAHCKECMSKNEKKTLIHELICKHCGKVFTARTKNAKFCEKCRPIVHSNNIKGKNHPNYNGGINVKCNNCGKDLHINMFEYNKHNHHFCSRKCYGEWKSKEVIGENNPAYDSNLTDEYRKQYKNDKRVGSEIDNWREQVYERDNDICQCCGKHCGKGERRAHHMNGYHWCVEQRHDVNNGVTLCDDCHKKIHKIYGNKNNTKEQFDEFLNKCGTYIKC